MTGDVAAEREVVVLLHSGGMSSRQWRKLGELLTPQYRVIAPDFLGSGSNPPWPPNAPFDFHEDVTAIAESIAGESEPVHVVGHSYGGLIALTLARLHPSRVRSVAVFDPVAFGVLHGANDEAALADLARTAPVLRPADPATGGNEAWLEAFVDYWNGPGTWRAMPAPSRSAFLAVGRKVFLEVESLSRDLTPVEAYAALAVPILILVGERSPLAARRVAEILCAGLPSALLHEVAGAGHMGPISHAGEVNALIARHLAAAVMV